MCGFAGKSFAVRIYVMLSKDPFLNVWMVLFADADFKIISYQNRTQAVSID